MELATYQHGAPALRPYWVSWYATKQTGSWELHAPWWRTGWRQSDDGPDDCTICAAVMAADEDGAKAIIRHAHDNPNVELEWRFVEERDREWQPFSDRFPRAAWMRWPT